MVRPPRLDIRSGVARRITLVSGIFLFVVIGLLSAAMVSMLLRRSQDLTVAWMDAKIEAVAQALDAHDQTSRLMVERFFKVFGDQFGRTFTLDESAGRLTQLGIALNDYHNPCDKFTEFTGAAAAVLMKQGSGFQAISSSLTDERGERTLSFGIDAGHPAHALLQAGEPYTGRATLFSRPYMTRLQPVRDLQGQIVGALFVAFDLTAFDQSLRRTIDDARFFDSGGVYVLNPGTTSGARPSLVLAPRGVLPEQVDAGAVQPVVAAHTASGDGQVLRAFTSLLRPGDADRFAVARTSPNTGWLVVGEASGREATQAQRVALVPFLALLALTAAALCAGQYALIRRWVARPLAQLVHDLERVASGNLSVPVVPGRDDEIGSMKRGVEAMRLRFVDLLGSLRESAQTISVASTEIASGNQDLSHRTESTAARLQETTSAMTQLCRSVAAAQQAAQAADRRSGEAARAAERGAAAVDEVVECMTRIHASSRRINEITGVIDGIAFQTNLLALNAAVEAARAGDRGRGFSVVAAEVRSLAQRATQAAQEIKQLLDDSTATVDAGSGLAQSARERMHDIASCVHELSDTLRTINDGAVAQARRLAQVSASMGTVDAMTQQNAALVEQSAAAATHLQSQAEHLAERMAVFRLA